MSCLRNWHEYFDDINIFLFLFMHCTLKLYIIFSFVLNIKMSMEANNVLRCTLKRSHHHGKHLLLRHIWCVCTQRFVESMLRDWGMGWQEKRLEDINNNSKSWYSVKKLYLLLFNNFTKIYTFIIHGLFLNSQ